MAKDKNSFVAYCDWIDTFEALPDDKAGQLAKHLFRYVNDLDPKTEDVLIKAVFAGIKQTLKRDLSKYNQFIEKQRFNGSKGGRPKKSPSEAKKPKPLNKNPSEAKKADSVSDSVNDSVSDRKNNKDIYRQFSHLKLFVEEFEKLKADYSVLQIDEILDSIENYKKNTAYKSLYLTAKKWLKKEYGESKKSQEKKKIKFKCVASNCIKRYEVDTEEEAKELYYKNSGVYPETITQE